MSTFVEMPQPALLRNTGRRLYRRMAAVSWPEPQQPGLRASDLEWIAAFVDVLAFCLASAEITRIRGMTRWEQLEEHDDWVSEIRVTSGISLEQFVSSMALLTKKTRPQAGITPPLDQVMQEVLHSAGEFLRIFPVAEICILARSMGATSLAHRIHIGTDQLSAIYRRADVPESPLFRIAALAYAKGTIDLDVAANMLGLGRADLLAALEVNGFARPPEVIALDDAQRRSILARMRDDRLHRAGKPDLDRDLLARDVIASQRIEGVDARRWLPR